MDAGDIIAGLAILASIGTAIYAKAESDRSIARAKNAGLRADEALQLAKDHDERDKQRLDRERADEERKRNELRIRLWMFAHEAVELHKRWSQYLRQTAIGELSYSLPFEWTTERTVSEFLSLGGDQRVIRHVYRVKHLNFQVTNQQRTAHDVLNAGRSAVISRAAAFILAEPVADDVAALLNFASDVGNDVSELRAVFDTSVKVEQEASRRLREPRGST